MFEQAINLGVSVGSKLNLGCCHESSSSYLRRRRYSLKELTSASSKRESSLLSLLTPGAKSSPYSWRRVPTRVSPRFLRILPSSSRQRSSSPVLQCLFIEGSPPPPNSASSLMHLDTATSTFHLETGVYSGVLRMRSPGKRIFRIQ